MLSWKVIIWIVLLSLHGATRSTRSCNKRASLSAWLSFFLQHVGRHRSKNDHDEEIKSQIFYWSCYMYCCERQGRKFQALRETKNTWNFFVIEPIAAPPSVLVHFFQVLLTWLNPLKLNTYFCSLQWVEKVIAQMIPSSSPLVKFWHGSLFVTSTVCMYDHGTP